MSTLKALPLDNYDGVVLTNLFAQCSDWDDVALYCRQSGKALVVDNATGLLDRPKSALNESAPMETVSPAHHTKPWGVGEGGFIICNPDEEEALLRKMINFGVRLPHEAAFAATNAKLSDYSAAAIPLTNWSAWKNGATLTTEPPFEIGDD